MTEKEIHSDYGGSVAEKWQPIPNIPNLAASSLGRIKNVKTGVIRKVYTRKGYQALCVRVNHSNKNLSVHRLVSAAWNGNCPPGMEVAHLDGDVLNNSPINLAVVSRLENESHKEIHGTRPRLISPSDREKIRATDFGWRTTSILAKMFGVHRSTIKYIRYGKKV